MIFNKNRKSGSSTLRNIIKALSKLNNFPITFNDRTGMDNFPHSMTVSEERAWTERMKALPPPHVFIEHFYFVNHEDYDKDFDLTWINLVRDPVERFVSLFHHQRKEHVWRKSLSKPPKVRITEIDSLFLIRVTNSQLMIGGY